VKAVVAAATSKNSESDADPNLAFTRSTPMHESDEQQIVEQRTQTGRQARRLFDEILVVFHAACDQTDVHVALCLIKVLEFMRWRVTTAPDSRERRARESLVAAHERLWQLTHPDAAGRNGRGGGSD
jgi:hypothetical protein